MSNLILIITSLAIHYSQNVFHGFSILVCIGVQLFFRGFFLLLLSLSRSPRNCLRLTEKRWKIAPVLQIQASSMKLRIHGFLVLELLLINNTSLNNCCFLSFMSTDARQTVSIYLLSCVCLSIPWTCCLRSILFLLK